MKLRANKFVFYAIASCFLSGNKYGHMVWFFLVCEKRVELKPMGIAEISTSLVCSEW